MQKVEKNQNEKTVEKIENKKKNIIEHLTGAEEITCSDTSTSNSKTIPSGCVCSSEKTYQNAQGEIPNEDGSNGPYYCN